jgi:hypothetical protein
MKRATTRYLVADRGCCTRARRPWTIWTNLKALACLRVRGRQLRPSKADVSAAKAFVNQLMLLDPIRQIREKGGYQ